jgi:hypothetical protein
LGRLAFRDTVLLRRAEKTGHISCRFFRNSFSISAILSCCLNFLFSSSRATRSGKNCCVPANVPTFAFLYQFDKVFMEIPSCRYLSDVLQKLPTHKVPQIEELLPHCWKPKSN